MHASARVWPAVRYGARCASPTHVTEEHGQAFCRIECTAESCPWSFDGRDFSVADANKLCPSYISDWQPGLEEPEGSARSLGAAWKLSSAVVSLQGWLGLGEQSDFMACFQPCVCGNCFADPSVMDTECLTGCGVKCVV